jgi:hypothetical protein
LTAADNGSKTFSVYASFNTTVTDNQNIGLTVSAATPSPSGSGFAAGNAGAAASVVTGNTNKIVVTATKLLFGTVPGGSHSMLISQHLQYLQLMLIIIEIRILMHFL